MWKVQMVVSGTGKRLGWQYPVLLLIPNVQGVDFASFQPLRSQHSPPRLVFGLYLCPTTILYSNLCLPFHPPLHVQCKHPWHYGTAQLQGNVCTCSRRVLHASQMRFSHIPDVMCPTRILDASCIWQERAWQLIKSCCSLLQGFVLARTCLVRILEVSYMHFGCIWLSFWMRLACALDTCEHYLRAEPYHTSTSNWPDFVSFRQELLWVETSARRSSQTQWNGLKWVMPVKEYEYEYELGQKYCSQWHWYLGNRDHWKNLRSKHLQTGISTTLTTNRTHTYISIRTLLWAVVCTTCCSHKENVLCRVYKQSCTRCLKMYILSTLCWICLCA